MKRVFKYRLPVESLFELELPSSARVLTLQEQYGEPQLWALVDDAAPTEKRKFVIIGTGHDAEAIGDAWRFVGTVQLHGGRLVLHMFEIYESELLESRGVCDRECCNPGDMPRTEGVG